MDRDKALDMAVGQIEKQYGKGAVMRLGDQANQTVACIPTGAISLDLALGVGGIPRGRVTEIYGPEASGKCTVAGTYLWTDQGLETVEELFERCGQPASCTSRVTDVRDQELRAVNERGELEGVAALTHNNLKPVLRLRLRTGRTVEVTHNHPLRIVTERGFLVWREAGEIREGDTMVSAAFGAEEAAEGDGLDEDEAVLLGYLVAEGSLSERTKVRFTNWDPEVGEDFLASVRSVFGDVKVRCYDGKEYAVGNTTIRDELEQRYGLGFGVAAAKHMPHCVRTAGAKVQRAFLSALFEGDGWIDGSSSIGLASASKELAEQVQLLLLGLGIPASLTAKWNSDYERHYWTVTINPACVGRFVDEIGFRSARRQRQVEASFHRSKFDPQLENVPHVAGLVRDLRDNVGGDREFDRIAGDLFRGDMTLACSRTRLQRIVAWAEKREAELSPSGQGILTHLRALTEHRYIFERVEQIEEAGEKPTFDLMLPQSHSFLANGVLSHNTTVALHVVAEAQNAGGIAAFIDAEHALDPSYAKALGVDTEELLVSQPDTGEQALEIADMLVRSGAVDVIVIDSVAALTPKAEIEGEMGDSHVGLQARLMSQALRKLSGTLHRSRTSAVFINQLREKVGVMFGSPETTPGGRALKFYSSVRLDVRRIESLKDGNDAIGNRVRVKVVKNKCLAAGTRVFDAATGETHRIEEIVENQQPVTVWAVDKRGKLHQKPVTGWFAQGEQEVLPLILGDGTTIRVTPDHLMRTDQGWRPAGELTIGDHLARPRLGINRKRDDCHPDSEWLPPSFTASVLAYLHECGITADQAAALIGVRGDEPGEPGEPGAGLKQVLGGERLRRKRLETLSDGLDSSFLREILEEDVFYDRIEGIGAPEQAATYDVEVADLHNLVADDVVVHNCAPPFRQAEFDLMYGHGISKEGSLLDLGVDHGIVKKAGAWYTYEGEQLGQGRENAKKFLAEHEDVANTITKLLHEQLGLVQTDVTGDDAVADTEAAGGTEVEPETKTGKGAKE